MSAWILGDAIIWSGGCVDGNGPVACSLRGLFECVPSQVTIVVGSPPSRRVRVDLNSDWMLAQWLRERGSRKGLLFTECPALAGSAKPAKGLRELLSAFSEHTALVARPVVK